MILATPGTAAEVSQIMAQAGSASATSASITAAMTNRRVPLRIGHHRRRIPSPRRLQYHGWAPGDAYGGVRGWHQQIPVTHVERVAGSAVRQFHPRQAQPTDVADPPPYKPTDQLRCRPAGCSHRWRYRRSRNDLDLLFRLAKETAASRPCRDSPRQRECGRVLDVDIDDRSSGAMFVAVWADRESRTGSP